MRPAWFALVYLPFLLPPVLMHTQQPFRTTWSTWTELFLVFMLVAIYLRGMTDEETAMLTDVMAHSGDMVDLSAIAGIKADKHSTGGVGDKTTLVIAPIVAACGGKIAKMSGRGLGHTGGTIDKMEAVPGTRTSLTQEEFFRQVNEIGISVIGQSGKIAVADKKMYALRDVTATVGCIPLIASSIMSKKLAAGSDAILLDVTMGDGAFMKDLDGALELARCARGTPRIANRMLKRVRDFATVQGDGTIDEETAIAARKWMDIDELGLDELDRSVLAAALGEESVTLEDICEPYLMQMGMLTRTPRGRCVTRLAYEHLHMAVPKRFDDEDSGQTSMF